MRSITILATAIALAGFSIRADDLRTKVEEELGPCAENCQFWSVSADGKQVSQIKTIRQFQEYALLLNGKEIKHADEFGDGAITFSPDGKRTAFFQFNAKGGFAVIDGKATESFRTIAEDSLRFTSDGKHVVFSINDGMAMVYDGKPFSGGITFDDSRYPMFTPDGNTMQCFGEAGQFKYGLVVNTKTMGELDIHPQSSENSNFFAYTLKKKDGQIVPAINDRELPPVPDLIITGISVSNDGLHYAITGKKPDKKEVLLLDGKPICEYGVISRAQISPDGAHVIYSYKKTGEKNFAIAYDNADVVKGDFDGSPQFSPDGNRLAMGIRSAENFPKFIPVLVDGKIPEIKGHGVETNSFRFSPDSSRLAYVITSMNHKKCVVIDGKTDLEFETIHIPSLHFTPKSKYCVYTAGKNNPPVKVGGGISFIEESKFVVFNGKTHPSFKKIPSTPDEFVYSPDDQRIAYIAKNENLKSCLVLDGVPGAPFDQIFPNTIAFSDDGNHLAYVACILNNLNVPTYYVIMDGVLSLPYSTIFAKPPLKPRFESDNALILPVEEKGKIQRVRFYPPANPPK